jgi:alpha/beta superfamily hydrolase
MRAVSFDFRGCGASGGELRHTTITTGIRDFTSVATHVAREGDAIGPGFVASSFGAAVALAVASDYNARRLLLKAPMINIAGAQLQRRGAEEMERWKRSGSIVIDDEPDKILDYDYVADAARYDLYDSQLVDPMLSIDIVQGTLDEVAPISFTRKFVELSDARTLFAIEGADHHFSTPAHFDEMIERLSDGIRTLSRD